jgi:hypothetical protein
VVCRDTGTRIPKFQRSSPASTSSSALRESTSCSGPLLDTGAHFCLLNATVARLLGDQLTESLGTFSVRTAYGPVKGELYLHTITLVAESGESLDVEATVFVPPDWRGPCFFGYAGFLDRMRFAINPRDNQFQFGGL